MTPHQWIWWGVACYGQGPLGDSVRGSSVDIPCQTLVIWWNQQGRKPGEDDMSNTRITVTLEITVDPEAWYDVYGQGRTLAEVRRDVREYVLNDIQQSAGMQETEATVVLR